MAPSVNMIRLQDAISGQVFHAGLATLLDAYRSARADPDRALRQIDADAKKFQARIDAGEAQQFEYEDGQIVYDYADDYGELAAEAREVIKLVEEAFVVALAHFWERFFLRRLGATIYREAEIYPFLQSKGWPLNTAKVEELRLCANVVKHSSGRSANELLSRRPDMFIAERIASGQAPGYENLKINEGDLREFFQAVEASGPRHRL